MVQSRKIGRWIQPQQGLDLVVDHPDLLGERLGVGGHRLVELDPLRPLESLRILYLGQRSLDCLLGFGHDTLCLRDVATHDLGFARNFLPGPLGTGGQRKQEQQGQPQCQPQCGASCFRRSGHGCTTSADATDNSNSRARCASILATTKTSPVSLRSSA